MHCVFVLRKNGVVILGPEHREAVKNVAHSLNVYGIPHEKLTASEVLPIKNVHGG